VPHPYAEIIDLFRDASAPPAPPVSVAAAAPPVPPTPGTSHAAAPTVEADRQRRAVMLLPVALLALAGGAAAAVIHHHDAAPHSASRHSATEHTATPVSSAPTPSAPPAQPAVTAAAQEYSRALDQVSAAQDPEGLVQAARGIDGHVHGLRGAKGRLAHAEADHVDALVALGTLDASTPGGLASYPRLVTAAERASDAVRRAAGERHDVPDPTVATGSTTAIIGRAVVEGLRGQVGHLADATAAAHLTAQLRIAAAQAEALIPAASRASSDVADPGIATTANAYARALRALGALRAIDADHLGSWTALKEPLQQTLVAAGVAGAARDVQAIEAMITAAQQKMDAWAAQNGAPAPDGSTPAHAHRGLKAAQAAAKAAESYATRADALVDRYAQAIATLPAVSPGQQPSYELAARFNRTSGLLESLTSSVAALHAPAGMAGAHAALADLVARGRAAATTGQDLAISATECNPDRRVCVLGAMSQWPAYKRDVAALSSPAAVRSAIAAGVRTAQAAVAATAGSSGATEGPDPSTTGGAPPKPIV